MPLQFVKSQRGKPKLCLEGYLYHEDKSYATHTTWECELRKKNLCRARVTTEGENVVEGPTEHTHAPNPAKIVGAETTGAIRKRAAETMDGARRRCLEYRMTVSPGASSI